MGGVTETVQVLAGTPLIDVASTTHQKNIPAEEFEVIPKGRSFQALATALPSVNQGELEGGFQVNGASAGENNFTVDGVSVVSQIHGNQRQDAVFEYLQEVQVKTSGLEAEYGGALGGVISAVTKSGGNTFRGSLYEHYSASWLRSDNGLGQASGHRSDHAELRVSSFRTTTRVSTGMSLVAPSVGRSSRTISSSSDQLHRASNSSRETTLF